MSIKQWNAESIERNRMQSNNCDLIVERNPMAIEYCPGFVVRLLRLRSIVFYYIRVRSIDSIVINWPAPRSLALAATNTPIGIGVSKPYGNFIGFGSS